MPLSLVYANRRNLSTRVRVVMDWLTVVMRDYIETGSGFGIKKPPLRQRISGQCLQPLL